MTECSFRTRRRKLADIPCCLGIAAILACGSCTKAPEEPQAVVEAPIPIAQTDPRLAESHSSSETSLLAFADQPPNSSAVPATEELNSSAAGSSPATTRTGEDWPRFLGPRDSGISGESGLQAPWPEEGLPILWEKEVGTGYSAPSVRGNRLVLHHRLQKEEIVVCFAADTGAELWKYAYPSDFRDPYGYNNGPRCSPLLTKDRCYTFGAEGKLLCLDLETGKQIWIRDTAADWNIPEAFFGVGSTPILEGKLLIVMVGGQPRAGIVAFHADTGETAWEAVGKGIWKFPQAGYQIDDKLASYSSLLGATINGKRHVLALMRDGLVSVTPHTGRVNFSYFFRSRMFESVNAARPVVVGNQIFLSAAYRAGAALLKVETDGDNVTELWKNNKLETHWSTTIAHAGYLYGFSGRHEPEGTLRCLDLKTGEVQWETEGAGDDVPFSPKDGLGATEGRYYGRGSAILADGHFIVLGERGVLALVEANPKEFKEISRFKYPQMNYPSWAAPVLSRQRLYLRDENNLLCLDLAKPAPKKKPSTP